MTTSSPTQRIQSADIVIILSIIRQRHSAVTAQQHRHQPTVEAAEVHRPSVGHLIATEG
jgi:hypothetical protein